MKKNFKILAILLWFFNQSSALYADPINDIGNFLKDTFSGIEKSFLRSGETLEKKIIATIDRINNECCEDKFEKKEELLQLKNSIEKSYKEKNHLNPITNIDFRKSEKYLLQVNLEKADKLLLENTKKRLEVKQEENKTIQASKISLEEKLKNSQDIIGKLQKEIEDIIKNYDIKLNQLETENKTLKDEMTKLEKKIAEISKKNNSWWKK